jgi:hypothetical protein
VAWFLQVRIDKRKMSVHGKLSCITAKTMTPRALASHPIDFVSAAGTVRVPKVL